VSINGFDTGVKINEGELTVSDTVFNVRSGWGIDCIVPANPPPTLLIGDNVTVSDNAEALLHEDCL